MSHRIPTDTVAPHPVLPLSSDVSSVTVGVLSKSFHGLIKLNDSGLIIWNALAKDVTEADIVAAILEQYEVDPEQAAADVHGFVEALKDAGIVVE